MSDPAIQTISISANGLEAVLTFAAGGWTAPFTANDTIAPVFTVADSLPGGGTTNRLVGSRFKSASLSGSNLVVTVYLRPYGISDADPNWKYAPHIASIPAVTCSCAEHYVTDTNGVGTGVVSSGTATTNSSTLAYPVAIGNWCTFDCQRQTGAFTVLVDAAHLHGVASVAVTMTDNEANGTTQAQDSFIGTSGTALASHVADTGQTWSKHPIYPTGTYTLSGSGDVYAGAGATAHYVSNLTPSSADYDVESTLFVDTTANMFEGVTGRVDPVNDTFYAVRYSTTNSDFELSKRVAGVSTTLLSVGFKTIAVSKNYKVRLRMRGTSISMLINGVLIGTVTDSSITAAGGAGIIGGPSAFATSTGTHQKNWSVYAAGVAATQTITQTAPQWISDPASLGEFKGYSLYAFNFNASGHQFGPATLSMTVTPNIGSSGTILTSGTTPPNLTVFLDSSNVLPPPWAYVDPVNGNNTTGVASPTRATAKAAPFQTMNAALYAGYQYQTTNYGYPYGDGVQVALVANNSHIYGTYSFSTATPTKYYPLQIVPDPDAAAGSVNIANVVDSNGLNTKLISVSNISVIVASNIARPVFSTPTISGSQLFWSGVSYTGLGRTNASSYVSNGWGQISMRYSSASQNPSSAFVGCRLALGCYYNSISFQGYNNTTAVVDCSGTGRDPTGTANHSDLYQIFASGSTFNNFTINGLTETNAVNVESFFMNGQSMSNGRVRGLISRGTGMLGDFKFSAGNGANTVTHLLIESCDGVSEFLVVNDAAQTGSTFTNCMVRSSFLAAYSDQFNVFHPAQLSHNYIGGVSSTFGDATVTGSLTSSLFSSTGPSGSFKPSTGSALLSHVPIGMRWSNADLGGTAWTSPGAIGLYGTASQQILRRRLEGRSGSRGV